MLQINKIYVGNISYGVTERELNDVFRKFGNIVDVCIIKKKESGRSKGFAFIRFQTAQQAQEALCLNGVDMKGRALTVDMARPKSEYSARDVDLRAQYKDLGMLL